MPSGLLGEVTSSAAGGVPAAEAAAYAASRAATVG